MTGSTATSAAVRGWQIALISVGALGLLLALSQLIAGVPPTRWVGIAAWLLGALVVHDGILAFAVLGASVLVRRLTTPIPYAVIITVQAAVVVAGVMTILVLPAIIKKAIGSANPTILPQDYVGHLGLFYVVVAVVTVLAVSGYLTVRMLRRQTPRKS